VQQFTIPQFIDVEDKIIGPITVRQFIIMLAGFLLIAICYKLFDFSLFVTVAVIIFGLSAVFSFAKINGRPFHLFILNMIQTLRRSKIRVWTNGNKQYGDNYEINEKEIMKKVPALEEKIQPSLSRLTELSLIVDTKGEYGGEKDKDINLTAINK
jgi:hypothetical protein